MTPAQIASDPARSCEIAANRRIPVVCAVSGPTTLAIETARAFHITLINFLRGQGMNIASCPERVIAP